MYCSKCLSKVDHDSKYCNSCGKKINKKLETLPTTTHVFGIIAIISSQISTLNFLGIITGIIGLVYGIKCRKLTKTPLSLSIIGLVLSSISWLSGLMALLYFVGYYLFYFVVLILVFILDGGYNGNIPGQFFM